MATFRATVSCLQHQRAGWLEHTFSLWLPWGQEGKMRETTLTEASVTGQRSERWERGGGKKERTDRRGRALPCNQSIAQQNNTCSLKVYARSTLGNVCIISKDLLFYFNRYFNPVFSFWERSEFCSLCQACCSCLQHLCSVVSRCVFSGCAVLCHVTWQRSM